MFKKALGIVGLSVFLSGPIAWGQQTTGRGALLIVVQDRANRGLAIADPITMRIVGSVPMSATRPEAVAVSADGRFAYVTATDGTHESTPRDLGEISGDYISVIDLVARKELRRVETGPGSWPFSLVVANGKVFYTAEGYGLVGRYDPASNQIDRMIGIGQMRAHTLAVTKDGQHIFVTNGFSSTITAIGSWDVPANNRVPGFTQPFAANVPYWATSLIPVGLGPEGIGLSPDEKEVWVLSRGDGKLTIIDVATDKVLSTLDLHFKRPYRVAFTPDGNRACFTAHGGSDVLIFDVPARKEIKRINVGKEAHDILIPPDGSRAYVTVAGSSNIAVIDLKTLELTGNISTPPEPMALGWAIQN
jgi:YVTN family beta-propeller protein